jgi:hypothetical protein
LPPYIKMQVTQVNVKLLIQKIKLSTKIRDEKMKYISNFIVPKLKFSP